MSTYLVATAFDGDRRPLDERSAHALLSNPAGLLAVHQAGFELLVSESNGNRFEINLRNVRADSFPSKSRRGITYWTVIEIGAEWSSCTCPAHPKRACWHIRKLRES